ncbi:MAG TPA: hypothetical protein PLZ76_07020 [Bacillota bacterium]|nr:hypothetical protein [Bacillota bacterium]
MTNEILLQISQGLMKPREAYRELYRVPRAPRKGRAHFLKLRIRIPGERGLSAFLAFLFLFPLPLFIVRLFLRKMKPESMGGDVPFTPAQMMELIRYRGINIEVKAKDGTRVLIKTL